MQSNTDYIFYHYKIFLDKSLEWHISFKYRLYLQLNEETKIYSVTNIRCQDNCPL